MTRISQHVTNITDAAELMAGESSSSLNILTKLISEEPPASAWIVLYKLDEEGVYDEAIAGLYNDDSSSEMARFVATVKSRQFRRNKSGE